MKKLFLLVLIAAILATALPIGLLYFTDVKVVNFPLSHYYLVDLREGELESDLIIEYMTGKGWTVVDGEGPGYFFTKGFNEKLITNMDIKTIFE